MSRVGAVLCVLLLLALAGGGAALGGQPVEGHVVDLDGDPVTDVQVSLVDGDGTTLATVTTDPGGAFAFPTAPEDGLVAVGDGERHRRSIEPAGQAVTLRLLPAELAVVRIAGADRRATAAAVARALYPDGTATVVLATDGDFPDALATAPLATRASGPVLLLGRRLDDRTAATLDDLGAGAATVVGGVGAVPLVAQLDLAARGHTVERIAGEHRADTAALLARASVGAADEAVVVTGAGFADALSMSALAAAEGLPILVTGRDRLHADAAAALQDLGVRRTLVAGGRAALADAVVAELPDARRLAGADRYATSVAVAEALLARGGSVATVIVATGRDFPDGLVGGPLAARTQSPLLLIDGADAHGAEASWAFLRAHAPRIGRIIVLGGRSAVSDAVVDRLAALEIDGTAPDDTGERDDGEADPAPTATPDADPSPDPEDDAGVDDG